MNRRIRLLAIAVVALAAILSLGACGGSSESVPTLLRETFGPHSPVRSGRLNIGLGVDLKGYKRLKSPIALSLVGPFEGAGHNNLPNFNLAVALDIGGQNLLAGAIATRDKGYITLAGTPYVLPDSLFQQFKIGYQQASAQSAKRSTNTFGAFGINPSKWLVNPRRAGTEQVGGAQTTHITAAVNVPRLLADFSSLLGKANQLGVTGSTTTASSISPLAQAAIAQAVTLATVDLWTGRDDKILRRLKVLVSLAVPPAERQRRVGGLSSGTLSLDLTVGDIDRAQRILVPANPRPLSELVSASGGSSGPLGSLATAAGSASRTAAGQTAAPAAAGSAGAGSTGAASAGTTGSPAAAPPGYLACLQAANGDIAKEQACAPLINGH